jgi:cyanophycin synthetase
MRIFGGASRYLDAPHLVLNISHEPSLAHRKPLRTAVSTLLEDLPGPHEPLIESLRSGRPGMVLGSLAVSMQQFAGHDVRQFSVHESGAGKARVAVEQQWPLVAELAGRFSVFLTDYLFGDLAWPEAELKFQLNEYLKNCAKGPSIDTRYLFGEARKAGIPVAYTSASGLQFGQGFRMRRMERTLTDRTSHLAFLTATDKTRMIEALKQAGLPAPAHIEAEDADKAVAAAKRIGFPVVVKPVTMDWGVGVTVGIATDDAVRAAYETARKFDRRVAVERFVPGDTYRLLVIDGKFAAASRSEPAAITGDGKSTIRQIVDRINRTQHRGPGHQRALTQLALDAEALTLLASFNLTPDSIPKPGQQVRMRSTSNLSRGGASVAVTDDVHHDVRRLAELCASIAGLDIAGIDYRAPSISQSWRNAESAVIEVNPSPGLRMHFAPAKGKPENIGRAILGMLYPAGAKSRIPIAAVTGTNGKTTTTRMIAHILTRCGMVTARITTDEMAIGNHIIVKDDCAGPGPARRVLAMPHVEAAALEVARGGLLKHGLGFERCDVAVVTNIQSDHIGELGVDSLDELVGIKKIVADSADAAVVLNGDDKRCLAMANSAKDRKAVLFSLKADNPEVLSHAASGGTAFFPEWKGGEQWICRAEADSRADIIKVDELPITHKGLARHNIQNAMAAIAAAEQLGLALKDITAAAREFEASPAFNYGRLNFIEGFPFTVIVDYAHNKDAFETFCAFMKSLDVPGRKICTFGLNGVRLSDAAVLDTVAALAPHFDVFAPCDWAHPKLRRAGLRELMRQGLLSAGVRKESIFTFDPEGEGVQFCLRSARKGDLVAILGGVRDHVLKAQIELYQAGLSA